MKSGQRLAGKRVGAETKCSHHLKVISEPGGASPLTWSLLCPAVLGGVRGWSADTAGGVHDQPRQQPASGGLWEQPASRGHPV